ncbi:hypothetical protein CP8484711_0299, partial [Chlamydia psittaci 84-8471/1]
MGCVSGCSQKKSGSSRISEWRFTEA